ncbi:MAG: hypothetical protein JNJ61_12435 [Anaerolineae bacterium]|nr:hypothetical protein [Anaerolineae bacterium]
MSRQHPLVLFVGNPARGADLQRQTGQANWWVYLPEDALEALGIYITYLPDVVVLDEAAAPEITHEVYRHLRSVQAAALIVLTSGTDWQTDSNVTLLPPGIGTTALAEQIIQVIANNEVAPLIPNR